MFNGTSTDDYWTFFMSDKELAMLQKRFRRFDQGS
jgi:hypothetical protein